MIKTTLAAPQPDDTLRARAQKLGLYGLLASWSEHLDHPWLEPLIEGEERERKRRSMERRQLAAKLGRFKLLADFDWSWPKQVDRSQIEDLLNLDFAVEPANVIIVGPNGVGKTTIAQNLTHQAIMRGYTALHVTASEMLNDLAGQDSNSALTRRLQKYVAPSILSVDEVGYLSYDARHADLLFEVLSRRHQHKPVILTTNRPFQEWNEVFPNSSCVTALIDRLVHRAEIVVIQGESYRAKEARERAEQMARERKKRKGKGDKA